MNDNPHPPRAALALALATLGAAPARAQSLFLRPVETPVTNVGEPAPATPLYGASMLVLVPPEPRTFKKHDLITIIVNETSRASSDATLETEKDYEMNALLRNFVSIRNLLEAQLEPGDTQSTPLVDLSVGSSHEGEGTYERADRLTARITAEVIDVKPNGTLVLEARSYIQTDKEIQTFALAGVCRPDDVTDQNTIQSSQLANLTLVRKNEGDVHNGAKKGIIPQVLETVVAF